MLSDFLQHSLELGQCTRYLFWSLFWASSSVVRGMWWMHQWASWANYSWIKKSLEYKHKNTNPLPTQQKISKYLFFTAKSKKPPTHHRGQWLFFLLFIVMSKHIVNKKVSMVCYFGRSATLTRLKLLANRNSRSSCYYRQYLRIFSQHSRGVQVRFLGIWS